jgi:hypothetical protein
MIYFYSGTPGSGKSLRVSRDVMNKLILKKENVITNMYINYDFVRTSKLKKIYNFICKKIYNGLYKLRKLIFKKKEIKYNYVDKNIFKKNVGEYFYLPNNEFDVQYLYNYARKYHIKGKEGQTLIVIDEAQLLFSPSVVKIRCQTDKNYRNDWLEFFTQHRRLGFNIIFVSQFDRLIDPQVRCLFEYNNIHRKINNFKIGWLLSVFKIGLFVSVQYWYGVRE